MILREEVPTIKFAYASVFAFKDLEPGDVLTKENIWVARPGTGDFLATDYYKLLGNKVVKKVEKGKLLRKTDIDLK
jgi:N-acetylneuraminate synthase